jgi:hypothetical protein
VTDDPERKASKPKARFEQIVAALMRVGKDEVAKIAESEKKPPPGKKGGVSHKVKLARPRKCLR